LTKQKRLGASRKTKVTEASQVLKALGFGTRQSNETAAYVFLALLDITAEMEWAEARNPLIGITPIMDFISKSYGVSYTPNTRETVRDYAVKFFVEMGILLRNPDDPARPTNSGKTVYQVEISALTLLRSYGDKEWDNNLVKYLSGRDPIRQELERRRSLVRIPVKLPNGQFISLSPGGQNPLIRNLIEEFCSRFVKDGCVLYVGDAETKFLHLDREYLSRLGVTIPASAKIPDVIIHDRRRNWLVLIEAVTSAGPIDGKRRMELKSLFSGCSAGLVFVTAFENRRTMQRFVSQISWETEVWIADDPNHLIHFDGERFLGPYPDVIPPVASRKPADQKSGSRRQV
jgi:hypothetical protein